MPEVERISPEDEQVESKGLKVSIGQAGGFVIVEYSRPVKKLVLSKKHTREFATRLVKETLK